MVEIVGVEEGPCDASKGSGVGNIANDFKGSRCSIHKGRNDSDNSGSREGRVGRAEVKRVNGRIFDVGNVKLVDLGPWSNTNQYFSSY